MKTIQIEYGFLSFRKKATKPDTSLEERIRQLTCNVDEPNEHFDDVDQKKMLERRGSPTGEENPQPQVTKYVPDKSFSPISTASSSSNSSISTYKKITDIFHKDKRQERIPEADENPIVIIPQVGSRKSSFVFLLFSFCVWFQNFHLPI